MDGGHDLDGAGLEQRRPVAEQRLVEPAELPGRAPHPAAGLDLGHVPGLVVDPLDVVRDHLQAAVELGGDGVALPGDRHEAGPEGGLLLEGHAEAALLHTGRSEHLVGHVAVDRPAVDRLDHGAEDLPAAGRVVAGLRARFPLGGVGGDAGDGFGVGDVGVEQLAPPGHREAAGVDEDVAQRHPLLPRPPAGDVLRHRVVEAELAPLPQVEDGGRRDGFPGRVPHHHVVALEGPPRGGLADGHVEERFPEAGDVGLGPVVEPLGPLAFEGLDDLVEGPFAWFVQVSHRV